MYLSEHILQVWANEALQQKPYPSPLFPPSPYYRFLGILSREIKPVVSVVLGVCGGGDCLHMALGNPNGLVVGVDYQDDHPEQIEHIKKACPNFVFYLGDSCESAETIYQKYGKVSLLFIDTSHTYEQTIKEMEAWKPYLNKGHVICFDDLFRTEMDGFWEHLEEPKLRLDRLHDGSECGGGFGVYWSLG